MSSGFSKEEQAIYDRQIRVWGFNAQLKLKNSTVGVIGTTGLSIELLKNLVLAGVGGIVIMDDKIIEEETLGSNFYINSTDLGKKAEVSAEKLRLLNPKVSITTCSSWSSEIISGLTLLCCTDKNLDDLKIINELCRSLNVSFVSGNTFGLLGFIFLDLGEQNEKQDKTEEQRETIYSSLSSALETCFSSGTRKQLLRKLSPQFFINMAFMEFFTESNRMPGLSPEDLEKLKNIFIHLIQKFFPVNAKIQEELIASCLPPLTLNNTIPIAQAELAPCTAILGGIMAQEVLKAISCKDSPVNNFFVYNGLQALTKSSKKETDWSTTWARPDPSK